MSELINLIQASLEDGPVVGVAYFVADAKKSGGEYVYLAGPVKKIDEIERTIVMREGAIIPIDDIIEIVFEE